MNPESHDLASLNDDELIKQLRQRLAKYDYSLLDPCRDECLRRRPQLRATLAGIYDSIAAEYMFDAECGKADLQGSWENGLEAAAICQELVPDSPEYLRTEARIRMYRGCEAAKADDASDRADLERALELWRPLADGPAPEADDHRGMAEALLWRTPGGPPDADIDEAFVRLHRAYKLGRENHTLNVWLNAIEDLAGSSVLRLRERAALELSGFDQLMDTEIKANPGSAAAWAYFYERRAERGDKPCLETMKRAAALWIGYANQPDLSAEGATTFGHSAERCGRLTGDRTVLLVALNLFEHAWSIGPCYALQIAYIAGACKAIALLPGTSVEERRHWLERAVEAFRERPEGCRQDEHHYLIYFAQALLDQVELLELGPDHPHLEEAAEMGKRLEIVCSNVYLSGVRTLARARFLQGRIDEVESVLKAANQRFKRHGMAIWYNFASDSWFLRLPEAVLSRLQADDETGN